MATRPTGVEEMGMADKFDEMKDNATDATGGAERAKDGVQSAADKGDELTGGRYSDQIDKGQDAASEKLDEWDTRQ